MTRPRILMATLVFILVAAFVLLAVGSAARQSATYDEPTHLASGYSYWRLRDYRMNPEHPPLLKLLAAAPLLWQSVAPGDVAFTEAGLSTTSTSSRTLLLAWALGLADDQSQWYWSHHWLYGVTDQALQRLGLTNPFAIPSTATLARADFVNDADRLLFWGRLPMVLLGALLALLVFGWARELFGVAGGLLALTLFCFDPSFIAHSGLVATDVGVAVFMFGTMYFLWRCHRRPRVADVVLLAVFLGLALASKFTAILLAPVVVLVAAIALGAAQRGQHPLGRAALLKTAGVLVMVGVVAYGLLWATYGFRYSAAPDPQAAAAMETAAARQLGLQLPARGRPGHLPLEDVVRRSAASHRLREGAGQSAGLAAGRVADEPTLAGKLLLLADRWQLLPEAYLYGVAYAEMRSLSRGSFLLGRHSDRGWWYYFPVAFLLKTPTLSLVIFAAAIAYLAWRKREHWLDLAFLLVPVVVYVLLSSRSHLNIGHRHLLPIYPFLFVCSGGLALVRRPTLLGFARPASLLAIALGCFVVFAPPWRPAFTYPHFLAYFNELAGGPRSGYQRLVDSNLDWGQELASLKRWLDARGIRQPINLCYFGTADPRYHQIAHMNMPGGYLFEPATPWDRINPSGYFAVSATCLQGVYQSPQDHATLRRLLSDATLVDTLGYSLFIYHHD